ncbi:MAG: helix-turn-helix transcriptional regulator [Marmoricola sp.]|nr:helix-turn-helix transcriptional regulator [Marmoricola sp.]
MMTDVRTDRGRTENIVGRGSEIAALLGAATGSPDDSAAGDVVRMVLVSGDAGVGKTRLLTEAMDRLGQDGWQVLVGHCLDFGDTSMPYLPFAEMLDQVGERAPGDPVLAHAALSRMRHQVPTEQASEGLDRAEVFEAVHALVEELAAARPVVMVVEDAHWADASTRDLVSFLLSRRVRGRFLCVVTFRSDEMHRRHPLRQRVAEWVRLPGVDRVQLDPLPPGVVRRMVEELIGSPGQPPDQEYDEDIERIVQRSQGNAFYVEELVGAFLGGGWSLPEDLADLLLVRLDRLGEDARDVVRVASAAGQRVSHDLLSRVAPFPEDRLELALREAIDGHVLVRTGADQYAFRHALLGEAVYDDLLPGERMRLHTSYAAAVRELHGREGAASLARHALASHDLPTALQASVEAGEQALGSGGPDEAARHFAKALEIYERAAAQLDEPPDEDELVARTVDALCSAGRPETALALVDSHLERLPPDVPATARARLLLARVEALRSTETDVRASLVTMEALGLVGPGETELRARILAMHALALVWDDDFEGARTYADQALELADRLGIARVAAEVGLTLTWLGQHLDFGEGSRAELKRIIEEARARDDVVSEMRGWLRAGGLEYDYGALADAQENFLDAARLAREIGRPWTIQGISGRTHAGVMAHMRGEWDEALRIVDHGAEDPPPTPRAMLEAVALSVAAGRGDVSALNRLPAIRERWHREGMIAVVGGAAAIELLSLRDGAAAAVAMYDDVCGVLVPLWTEAFGARLRLAALALAALADEAPRTPTAGRDDVRATASRLVADAERVLADRVGLERPFGPEGRAWEARLRAEELRLAWLLGDRVDLHVLVGRWREVAERFAELGHPHEEARARTRLSAVLRAAGDARRGQEEAAVARHLAARLGATPLLDELGAARSGAVAGTLTPREREILVLVATGRSNGEIGRQLFISAKTVSVHVSNLMAKLGAASRTEAAALARAAGLID